MDRQTLLILALGLLAAAGLTVSISGWILFARSRRAPATPGPGEDGSDGGVATGEEASS